MRRPSESDRGVEILPAMPIVDVRDGGPLAHARMSEARARALRDCCLAFFPRPARALLPALDGIARRWLTRSRSPYIAEIAAIAAAIEGPGVWFLNGSYQWGCTTLAREEGGAPWLARTLDWPFPGLGRHAEVAHMRGPGGDFCSVTWPGYVGVLTGMAPGRFAVAINQAPLWRRTRTPYLRPYDMVANALHTWSRVRHIPPDQLVRDTLERCATFAQARANLEQVPVARPVIFTLVGCAPGETCVIERTEEGFTTRTEETSTANDWLVGRPGWEGRIAAPLMFACSYNGAAENSRARRTALAEWQGAFESDSFSWVVAPVLNLYTRLAVEMCPVRGILRAAGYEVVEASGLPQPVTAPCGIDARLAA
jgi:hypothetical protein